VRQYAGSPTNNIGSPGNVKILHPHAAEIDPAIKRAAGEKPGPVAPA
jgi:hypothetical protein